MFFELSAVSRNQDIEKATRTVGVVLHPVAVERLRETGFTGRLPFPRLERHDGYLLAVVYIPANTENPSADFDRLVAAVTHDHVIYAITRHASSLIDWSATAAMLCDVDASDTTPDGGQFLLNVLRLASRRLASDARNLRMLVENCLATTHLDVDLTKSSADLLQPEQLGARQRRETLEALRDIVPTIAAVRTQLPRIERVATETLELVRRLALNDEQSDLMTDAHGVERELFSRDLEIHLTDTLMSCRLMVGELHEVDRALVNFRDVLRQLSDEERLAAGRFTGAITSIMLLPTFIVGLYGQNFAEMPEIRWRYGYFVVSWGAIVFLTGLQIWFFRRRRWV